MKSTLDSYHKQGMELKKEGTPSDKGLALIWIDMEMTGLDPEKDTILELATIVTDPQLNIIGEGPEIAVFHDDNVLNAMDEWCQEHHGNSGLIKRVQNSSVTMKEAEEQTIAFLQNHVAASLSPLCGNSVHQDRLFISKYMPKLNRYLHYRNIDVSTVKELVRRWYPDLPEFEKTGQHTALKDIQESLEELKYYRLHVFPSEPIMNNTSN